MKHVLKLAAAGLALSFAGPVLAQDASMDAVTMTCADFMALDSDAQAAAVTSLETAAMSGDSATDSASTDSAATTDSASTETAATADSDSAAAAATADGSDNAAMDNPEVESLKTACEGNDDMLAADAMASAK